MLTAPWHERDSEGLVQRLGVPVYTPLPDSAEYLMQKYGITAEQGRAGAMRPQTLASTCSAISTTNRTTTIRNRMSWPESVT